ncbi:MAG TPA: hypothetical protein VE956_19530 [Nodularia sp. (in: cyanobacteria)]|nr:hypothetical protein [Nodularia sp. (in: cyanobacteria)]
MIRQIINPGTQRNLQDIFQLYRETGLVEQSYLEIRIKTEHQPTKICALKAKENYNLFEKIDVINEVHKIPERWNQQIDEIENNIYGHLEGLLLAMPVSLDDTQSLLNCLDYALSTSYLQKRGQDPFAFVRSCLLAALINDAEIALKASSSSQAKSSVLLKELTRRLEPNLGEISNEVADTVSLLKRQKALLSIAEAQKMRQIIKS